MSERGCPVLHELEVTEDYQPEHENPPVLSGGDYDIGGIRSCAEGCKMGERNAHLSARMAELEDFVPTADAVNKLPEGIRQYIAALETRCDPSGDTQSLICMRDTCQALSVRIEELEAENARLRATEVELIAALRVIGRGETYSPRAYARAVLRSMGLKEDEI